MKNPFSKLSIRVALPIVFLLCTVPVSAQRSGQSMSIQTGIVIAAQAVNLQSAAGRGAAVGGVVGLATTTMFISTQLTLAEVATARASAIQTVLEGIRAMPYDSLDTGGGETIGPLTVSWTSTTTTAQTKVVQLVSVGPGLAPISEGSSSPMLSAEVVDTVVYRVLRP